MTHRESKIERAKCDVRKSESRLAEARNNLLHGYTKAQAEMEREYARLKEEVARAEIDLQAETVFLKEIEDNVMTAEGDLT